MTAAPAQPVPTPAPRRAPASDRPILTLSSACVEARHSGEWGIWDTSFTLLPGELLLLRLEKGQERSPLADACCGVADLTQGTASFGGQDWKTIPAGEAARARGKIGRVFIDGGWISSLDVDENISLAQRHHTTRDRAELDREALTLCRMFGLPGLPRGRWWTMRPQDLRRAACARAFIGRPQLILLEQAAKDLLPDIMPALINACNSARARGAAILWTTDEDAVWSHPALRPTLRFTMSGARMNPADDETAQRTRQACQSPSSSAT